MAMVQGCNSEPTRLIGRMRRFQAGALVQDALRDQAADVRDDLQRASE